MTRAQLLALLALLGLAAGGIYVWQSPEGPQVCGLPRLGDGALYAALRVDEPQLNPQGDRCLPASEAAKLGKRARLLSGVLEQWQEAKLPADKCAAALVALEADLDEQDEAIPMPDAGLVVTSARNAIVQVCGPAPLADLSRLEPVTGQQVHVLAVLRVYARPADAPSIRILRQRADLAWPAAVRPLFDCSCSPGSGCEAQDYAGAWRSAPKTGLTLGAGMWRGAGCLRKPCSESAMFPRGHSMPLECWP